MAMVANVVTKQAIAARVLVQAKFRLHVFVGDSCWTLSQFAVEPD